MCARFEQDTKVFTLAFAHGWLAADDINDVDVRDDVRPTNRVLAVGNFGDGLKLHGASWGWPKPASMTRPDTHAMQPRQLLRSEPRLILRPA